MEEEKEEETKEEEEEEKEEGCSLLGTQSPFHRGRVWVCSARPAPHSLLACQKRCGHSGKLAGGTPGGTQGPSGGFIPHPDRPHDFRLLSAFNYTLIKVALQGNRSFVAQELICSCCSFPALNRNAQLGTLQLATVELGTVSPRIRAGELGGPSPGGGPWLSAGRGPPLQPPKEGDELKSPPEAVPCSRPRPGTHSPAPCTPSVPPVCFWGAWVVLGVPNPPGAPCRQTQAGPPRGRVYSVTLGTTAGLGRPTGASPTAPHVCEHGAIPKVLCPPGGRGKLRHEAPGARHAHAEGTAVALLRFGTLVHGAKATSEPGKGVAGPPAAPEGARASLPAPVANQPRAGAARSAGAR